MKINQRSIFAIFSVSLLAGFIAISPSHSAGNIVDPNQGWSIPNDAGIIGSQNGLFTERSSDDRDYSALLDTSKLGNNQLDPTCTSLDDTNCVGSSDFIYYAQLPVCPDASTLNCIVSVTATDSSGKEYSSQFVRSFPTKSQNQFTGDSASNLPSGGPGSIFSIPGAEGPAGNNYYVSFIMSGNLHRGNSATLRSIHATLVPIQLQDTQISRSSWCLSTGGVCDTGWNKLDAGGGKFLWNESGSSGTNCADTSWAENLCAEKEAFPSGFRFSIRARLSLAPAGWLHGRMASPDITITKNGGATELSVSAEPVGVPTVYKHYMWSDLPADLKALYDQTSGKYLNSNGEGFQMTIVRSTDPAQRAWTTAPSPYSPIAIAELNAWLPYVNNTATVIPQYWSFRSLTQPELQGANKCFSDPAQLNGIVTTNATAYSPGPPAFDKAAGNLNYQVAAPHFVPNGSDTFKGTYDLLMRSEVARCIYGFSSAPIKATISVINSTGAPEVATTIVGEKSGWLHLSANNFEFSSPTVSVSLQQDAPPSPPSPVAPATPEPVPSTTPIAPVLLPKTSTTPTKVPAKSIICSKGKSVKKVISSNGKCPMGYVKK